MPDGIHMLPEVLAHERVPESRGCDRNRMRALARGLRLEYSTEISRSDEHNRSDEIEIVKPENFHHAGVVARLVG
jgi:hypothetical protein